MVAAAASAEEDKTIIKTSIMPNIFLFKPDTPFDFAVIGLFHPRHIFPANPLPFRGYHPPNLRWSGRATPSQRPPGPPSTPTAWGICPPWGSRFHPLGTW